MNKEPHPIDRHVGSRVRLRRTLVGMSQEQLGAKLGVTFQQVQKYEKGSNRVSASRLWQIASILGVPVSYFFDGASQSGGESDDGFADVSQTEIDGLTQSTESLILLRHFTQIRQSSMRRAIIDLARSLAAASPPDSDTADS